MEDHLGEKMIEKARRLFPGPTLDEALAILDDYGAEPYQREKERVQLAALKISNGDLERLREAMKIARTDYRDVLAAAEYPNEFRAGMASPDPPAEADLSRARHEDARQYRAWLDGEDAAAGFLT
jgi:hypothetical protein